MAYYKIYFFGLVMHVEANGRGISGVVHDPDHDARLMFDEFDEVDLTDIRAVTITADDLTAKPAERQQTFLDYVPSAQKILGGSLESGTATGTGSKASYLHHVGGKLYAAELYEPPARYLRDQQEVRPLKCVSLLTLMLLESARRVTLTAGPVSRVLAPDSCILLANFDRENDEHDSDKKPHVRKYSRLTNFSDTSITIERDPDTDCTKTDLGVPVPPCDWVVRVVNGRGLLTAAHPECGNSAWP